VPLGRVKTVRVKAQEPIQRLFLRVDSEEAGTAMPAMQGVAAGADPGAPCDLTGTAWTGAEAGWIAVDVSGCGHPVTEVNIGTGEGAANLTGLSLTPPLPSRAWPWGDPVALQVVVDDRSEPISLPFDWTSVLQANDAAELLPLLDGPPEATSDSGGLILARLRWRQP
jgi:hypothetical protein